MIRVQAAFGGRKGLLRADIGQLGGLPAKHGARRRHRESQFARSDVDRLDAQLGRDRSREQAVDDRADRLGAGNVSRQGFARTGFQSRQGDRDALIAALAAQFLHNLGSRARQRPAFVQRQGHLPQLEPAHQLGIFTIRAGFQIRPGLAPFLILGHQRRAVAGFVGAIFLIHAFHGAGFVLGRVFLAHQFRQSLPDFRLATGDFHRVQHDITSHCRVGLCRQFGNGFAPGLTLGGDDRRGMPAFDPGLFRVTG